MNLRKHFFGILAAAVYLSCGDQGTKDAECLYKQQHVKEVCNGVDDDCDGITDEIPGTEACGWNGRGVRAIICRDGVFIPVGECQDEDKCKIGTQTESYTGPPETRNRGICHSAKIVCTDVGGHDADYRVIEPEQLPMQEICDKKDNNCNGLTDERSAIEPKPCWDPHVSEQMKGVGVCAGNNGWEDCAGMCVGATPPGTEVCNGEDDDCDGEVDEGLEGCMAQDECAVGEIQITYRGAPETRNVGSCQDEKKECLRKDGGAARWYVTQKEVLPDKESCDFLDADRNCNGIAARVELRLPKAYLFFFLDKSGSFQGADQEQYAVGQAVVDFAGDMERAGMYTYRYAVADVPDPGNDGLPSLQMNYTTAAGIRTGYTEKPADRSNEIFYDAFVDAADPANPWGLAAVPADAQEIYVGFTDADGPFTVRGVTQESVMQAVLARGAQTSMFITPGNMSLRAAFEQIVQNTGGHLYGLPQHPDISVLKSDLERIVLQCTRI